MKGGVICNMGSVNIETRISQIKNKKIKDTISYIYRWRFLYLLALPALIWYFIFKYMPIYGIKYAFTNFGRAPEPVYIGFENFKRLFTLPDFSRVFWNTIRISFYNIIFSFPATIILALLLNEVTNTKFKKTVQTVICLPNFLSWVVVAGIWHNILSPSHGVVNYVIQLLGGEPIYFWIDKNWFRPLIVVSGMWKSMGYGTIIYLAALSRVDEELYDAAKVDGAGRLRQTWHVTLPAIRPIIVITFILSFSGVLNIFEQIFVMMNNMVKEVADVIDTYTYHMGIKQMDVGFATAVGVFKNVVSLILVLITNGIAKLLTGESLF